MLSIAENWKKVKDQVAEAATHAGRESSEIQIVAVSKTMPSERLKEAVEAGVPILGENRVQEMLQKRDQLSSQICWHMIGHLQSNKAKTCAELFDFVESLDSVKTAKKLSDACIELKKVMPVLVQVKTDLGKEHGVEINDLGKFLDEISSL